MVFCGIYSKVYKDLIISTIVDAKPNNGLVLVYKDLIISTIVDILDLLSCTLRSIKTL